MALIKCPECGKEISDTIESCIHCGFVINKNQFTEENGKTINVKKKFPVYAIVVPTIVLIVLIIFGIIILPPYIKKYDKYQDGIKLLSSKQYSAAKDVFSELGDFKNSEEKVKECYYYLGKKYLKSGDLPNAASCFEYAGDYLDALELSRDTNDKIDKEKAERQAELDAQKREEEIINKFKVAYDSCSSSRTKLSSDGKSIVIDSKNKYDTESYNDVLRIIDKLDLSSTLIEEMNSTNALMGKQTEKYDHYEVSWSYHPDNGLDVIFKIVD